jgi:Mn2+/Fe2+ NRAMP family transporter
MLRLKDEDLQELLKNENFKATLKEFATGNVLSYMLLCIIALYLCIYSKNWAFASTFAIFSTLSLIVLMFNAENSYQRIQAFLFYLSSLILIVYGFAIYFSIITWTTVGYGDIHPSKESRPWAAAEALVGYVYMSLLIAQIINYLKPCRVCTDSKA